MANLTELRHSLACSAATISASNLGSTYVNRLIFITQ